MSNARIVYRQRLGTSPQDEKDVLCAAYKFVLFDSQAKKGGQYDLTSELTLEMAKNGPEKKEPRNKEQENT